jgi:hypothetical protein
MAGLRARIDRLAAPGVKRAALLGAALLLLGAASPRAATGHMCRAAEAPVFACPIGRKLVSVCAGRGSATYRFGARGRPEVQISGGRRAQRSYSGGGETQIAFARGGYRYVVYDRLVRTGFGRDGRHDPQASSGVLVLKGAKVTADLRCTGNGAHTIDRARAAVLPEGPFTERR